MRRSRSASQKQPLDYKDVVLRRNRLDGDDYANQFSSRRRIRTSASPDDACEKFIETKQSRAARWKKTCVLYMLCRDVEGGFVGVDLDLPGANQRPAISRHEE
jgi:hypothetical protein